MEGALIGIMIALILFHTPVISWIMNKIKGL